MHAAEFVPFALQFVVRPPTFVTLAIELDSFAIELGLELVMTAGVSTKVVSPLCPSETILY